MSKTAQPREPSEIILSVVDITNSGTGAEKAVLEQNRLYLVTRFVSDYSLYADANTDTTLYPNIGKFLQNRQEMAERGESFPAIRELLRLNGIDAKLISDKTLEALNNAGQEYLRGVCDGVRFDN